MRGPVRIVFHTLNLCWYAGLVALEIDYAVALLVPTTLVTDSNPAIRVTPTILALFLEQGLIRRAFMQFRANDLDYAASAW
jgi:hypothetical protein